MFWRKGETQYVVALKEILWDCASIGVIMSVKQFPHDARITKI